MNEPKGDILAPGFAITMPDNWPPDRKVYVPFLERDDELLVCDKAFSHIQDAKNHFWKKDSPNKTKILHLSVFEYLRILHQQGGLEANPMQQGSFMDFMERWANLFSERIQEIITDDTSSGVTVV